MTQWRDRVVEAETEISVVQEDINALIKQRKGLKQDISRYDKLVQREKQEMLKRLEEVEGQAQELEAQCQKTTQHKTRVEEMYVRTLDDYESMHDIVKEIQRSEQQLQEREDVDATLQRESCEWAEEEHRLRAKLGALQTALRGQRERRRAEAAALGEELAAAERQLQQLRRERHESTPRQPAADAAKHSRRGSMRSATSDAKSKEQQFITSNLSTGFPTRQLRSCLKNTSTPTGSYPFPDSSDGDHKNRCKGPAPHVQSAPVSRATSQALVAGDDGVPVAMDLVSATPHRAYSYVAGKSVGGRKRDISFLGDATNR